MPAPPRRPIGPRIEHAVPIPVGPPSIRAHRVRGLLINLSLSVVVTVAFVAGAEGLARWLEKPAPVVPLADTHGLDWREKGKREITIFKKAGGGRERLQLHDPHAHPVRPRPHPNTRRRR